MAHSNQKTWLAALLVIACIGIHFVHGDDEQPSVSIDEVVDMVKPFAENCEPIPEREHIVEMIENREDAKMETKCFRYCMLQQFQLIAEDSLKFDEDATIDMIGLMFSDKEEESRRIIADCNQQVAGGVDKCLVAHDLSMCMLREMRKAKYDIPEVQQ